MVATTTTVAALMKEIYEKRIEKQYNNELTALKRIERSSEGVTTRAGGKYVDFPIVTARNPGVGYRQENEALQSPGEQTYTEVHTSLYHGYVRGQLTAQLLRLAETDYQAFASSMDTEMNGAKEVARKDANRIVYGDGTGLLASVDAASGGASTSISVDMIQYLEEGMIVDVLVRSTGGAVTDGTTKTIQAGGITDDGDGSGSITVDATGPNTLTTHGIYRAGNYTGGTQREPDGFASMAATSGTLYGVDPTTYGVWKGETTDLSGPISEGQMVKMCDNIRRNGGAVSAIFTSLGVRRAYFNLLSQQRQFVNTKEFAGGFTGLPFNYGREIPVIDDVDAPIKKMWFIDESKVKVYQDAEWHFADEDGSVLKYVSGYDRFEYYMRKFWQIGTSMRGAIGLLTNVTEG